MYNFEYRLIDPLGSDRVSYRQLHNDLFKGAAIDDIWIDWYHSETVKVDPNRKATRTYGLFDGERLIGIWSVEPKNGIFNGTPMKVGRCFAVGISGDYRRMGLFVSLSEFAIKKEREVGEYEYILGFPQKGRSVIGGHLKAGWDEVTEIDINSIKVEAKGEVGLNAVTSLPDFPEISTEIDGFVDTAEYRNVRYVKHPNLNYLIYSLEDSFIVLKPYSDFCHILEISGSKSNVKILLEACKSTCWRHGWRELNVWNSDTSIHSNTLKECGFSTGAEHGLPITLIAVKINAKESLKLTKPFNFGMGAEEGY